MKVKYENKQLQAGKAELQQQMREQKEQSDDTIRQLRSKASQSLMICGLFLHIF